MLALQRRSVDRARRSYSSPSGLRPESVCGADWLSRQSGRGGTALFSNHHCDRAINKVHHVCGVHRIGAEEETLSERIFNK
jgi:hypothetical protein